MNTKPLSHLSRDSFTVATQGRGLTNITESLRKVLDASGLHEGLAEVFVHHTSCSLLLGENADPVVCRDLERFLDRLVPDGDPLFRHTAEGPDDMPAHVRAMLTGVSLSIPVQEGGLDLGTWQGAFLFEHRHQPHRRRVTVTLLGA